MTKKLPDAYITLDQFRQLASRFQAKTNFIKHKLETYLDVDESSRRLLVEDVIILLDAPADSFISQEDMSKPLGPHCEQRDFFDKELC